MSEYKEKEKIIMVFTDGNWAFGKVSRVENGIPIFNKMLQEEFNSKEVKKVIREKYLEVKGIKICRCCHEMKDINDDYYNGRTSYCIDCSREKTGYEARSCENNGNKEEIEELKAYAIEYNKVHPFSFRKVVETSIAYNREYSDYCSNRKNEGYIRNGVLKASKKWYEENKHKFGKKENPLINTEVVYDCTLEEYNVFNI